MSLRSEVDAHPQLLQSRPAVARSRAGPLRLAAAALRAAVSQPVMSAVLGFIAAATVLVTLATAGQTVSTQRAVLARFDSADLAAVQVLDDEGDAGLDAADIERVGRLNGVAWVLGLGPVVDVRVAGLRGEPVPSRVVVGSSDLLVLEPSGGFDVAAYVGDTSQQTLGLRHATGAVEVGDGRQFPVVGAFRAEGPLADLAASVLVRDASYDGALRRMYVRAADPASVVSIAGAVGHAVGDRDGTRPRIEVAADVAAIREAVGGELGEAGRKTVLQALAAGLVLGALTIFVGVQARRRDFGRRRALGATRGQLLGLVVLQATTVAAPGACVGAVGGAFAAWRLSGSWPGWDYPIAVAVLTVLAMALAALLPAIVAAYRDPVAAVRVP